MLKLAYKHIYAVEDVILITDKTHIKVLTLMIATELQDASSDALIAATLATELVSVPDIADAFEELIADKLLELKPDKTVSVTDKGDSVFSELEGLIPTGIMEQAKRNALRFHTANICKEEFFSKISESDGEYILTCKHTLNKKEVGCVILSLKTEKEAVLAKNNFEARPNTVMKAVCAAVTGNVDFLM